MDTFFGTMKTLIISVLIMFGVISPSVQKETVTINNVVPVSIISTTSKTETKVNPKVIPPTKASTTLKEPIKQIVIPVAPKVTTTTNPKEDKPLIINRTISQSDIKNSRPLDPVKILELTNIERVSVGLLPLTYNNKLSSSAYLKAKDMIDNKYFAHESPTGINVSDLADRVGYSYSLIGENLAMGDFLSSKDVVDGWMSSPGHRANILKPAFTEIGISAMTGMSDGREVWFSVQEFGRPSPNCLRPDEKIEKMIQDGNNYYKSINSELTKLKQNIDSGTVSFSDLNVLIDKYNSLVNSSNTLYSKTKELIASYNKSVSDYNICVNTENNIIGSK